MERIVFIERNTIRAQFRKPKFKHEWVEYSESAPDEVAQRVRDATIIINNKLSLGAPQLSAATKVKLIAIAATGSDCIDLNYCRARSIAVCNVRGYAANAVPEHVLALVLVLRRNLLAYREDVRRGLWNDSKQFCLLTHELHDIRNSTLGVVGYGAIGRSMARLGEAVGMRVLISERKDASRIRVGRAGFAETLQQSDVLTLHCPLTNDTRGLIGRREFQMMKRSALIINTARGALIDDRALIDALQNGLIGGAGLDVLRDEPPSEGNPLLDLQLPNLVITPHVAWASNEAVQTLADQVIDNLEGFIAGQPQNLLS